MASATAAQAAELSRIGLGRLLFALLRQRFTGMVTLPQAHPQPGRRTIWIRGGMPVFTDWESPRDRLGQLLVERGLISAALCGRGLHERTAGERLGQVLVRKGWLQPADLAQVLRAQCMRKLIHCFTLARGRVRVIPHEDLREICRDLSAPINVLELVHAGVTAHYDEGRIYTEMGAAAQGPMRASASLTRYRGQFGFRDEDEPVLTALAGGSRLGLLLRLPGPSPTRIAQLVYTLWACQMLRVGAAALRSRGAPTGSQSNVIHLGGEAEAQTPEAVAATFMSELGELEARIAVGAHAFELLGVPLTASHDEIRRTWRKVSAKFHPDALGRQGFAHLRDRATDVFACLSEAHRRLVHPDLRARVIAEVTRGDGRAAEAEER
ncbi:MAG: DnaJ domain-containing protein [Nannocystaceae bacterium]